MQILIVGSKGQLGVDLIQRAKNRQWLCHGMDLPECDITDTTSLQHALEQVGPVAAVINAAAYTAVDRAEEEVALAYAVNRDGPGHLACLCHQQNIPLIHISTDYVFDGKKTRPYHPSDRVSPMGVYGKSKAEGETAVRENCEKHVIVRTSWLFGLHGPNFVKTMLKLGKQRETLQIVDDQIGSPTYAGDLADALLAIASFVTQNQAGWGTYHFCNAGALTWYAFARKVFALARPYIDFKVKDVRATLTENYPTPAPRPLYSVLDCTSLENTFGIKRRPWQTPLKEMLEAHCTPGSEQ